MTYPPPEALEYLQTSGFFLLSGVFVVAGVAKLADTRKAGDGFASLKVAGALPSWVASRRLSTMATARIVAATEIALAVGLVFRLRIAALAAALLLAAFTVVLAKAVQSIRSNGNGSDSASPVTCSCFGALSTGVVTVVSVWRNVALAAIAIVLTVRPLPSAIFGGVMPATELLSAALTAALAALFGSLVLALANVKVEMGSIFAPTPPAPRANPTVSAPLTANR